MLDAYGLTLMRCQLQRESLIQNSQLNVNYTRIFDFIKFLLWFK